MGLSTGMSYLQVQQKQGWSTSWRSQLGAESWEFGGHCAPRALRAPASGSTPATMSQQQRAGAVSGTEPCRKAHAANTKVW